MRSTYHSQPTSENDAGRYVCAFAGRRDAYQVPIALEAHGLLETLVTDFYAYKWLRRFGLLLPDSYTEKLNNWHAEGIEEDHIRALLGVLAMEQTGRWFGTPKRLSQARLARDLAVAAAATARKTKANLFLYHSYAWEAFTAKYSHQPRRVLFQYHPHYRFEEIIYAQDVAKCPNYAGSYPSDALKGLPLSLRERLTDAWKHADLIICASSFTKRSLVWAGAEEEKCCVVPYGNDKTPLATDEAPQKELFQALFVGTGCTRKGLHHLLAAWGSLRLPMGKRLVLVCRDISDNLRLLAHQTPDVDLLPGVTRVELAQLYARSHLFVMPSLVEGFGQVYLEALTYGCPVLGTSNTALPDLGGESDGIFSVQPGNIEQLSDTIQFLAGILQEGNAYRLAAQRCAQAHSWAKFRTRIVEAL